jgi:hypothetical protein
MEILSDILALVPEDPFQVLMFGAIIVIPCLIVSMTYILLKEKKKIDGGKFFDGLSSFLIFVGLVAAVITIWQVIVKT